MRFVARAGNCLQGVILGLAVTTVSFAAGDHTTKKLSVTSSETVTPVIELYTSEGCSSCPRADRFLSQLGKTINSDFHAVPLAFHVDYWNWLGWTDPFSRAEYTARQREVGAQNQQSSIYTPEIVVAGKESRGGNVIIERIKYSNTQPATVVINLNMHTGDPGKLAVDFVVDNNAATDNVRAHIAIYENHIVREIGGGENSGKTLTHDFVVRHWSDAIELSRGKTIKMLSLEIDENWETENLGLAVIVINSSTGETLQAVNTSLTSLF